jgi:hypothetical protein
MRGDASSLLAGALVASALAYAPAARAEEPPAATPHWWLPVGLTFATGGYPQQSNTDFVLGGEVSFVYFHPERLDSQLSGKIGAEFRTPWLGGYADGTYDFAGHRARFTLGPEVGWGAFGIDGGLAIQTGGNGVLTGGAFRALLTCAIVAVYGRVQAYPGAPSGESVWLDGGLLFKLPIPLD